MSVSSERYSRLYFTGLFQIYGVRSRESGKKFTDNTERDNEVKKIEIKSLYQIIHESIRICLLRHNFKATRKMRSGASRTWSVVQRTKREGYKSERWMPRLLEATKDAVSCENLRETANM